MSMEDNIHAGRQKTDRLIRKDRPGLIGFPVEIAIQIVNIVFLHNRKIYLRHCIRF